MVPVVSAAEAPAGTESLAVQWASVTAPGLGVMLAAVARPQGAGPFPTLLLLHGSHGFALEYVQLAEAVARNGVLAVAACWFSGGGGAGSRFITPIGCPEASPMAAASGPLALQTVDALVQAASGLSDARPDRIGLFGHSRGGRAALNYILEGGAVQAVILNSAAYPSELATPASQVKAPFLMLHGTADSPADGGGASTNVRRARDFEAALRRAGTSVEAMYYEGGRHNSIFTNSAQRDDEVQRLVAFLRRHL